MNPNLDEPQPSPQPLTPTSNPTHEQVQQVLAMINGIVSQPDNRPPRQGGGGAPPQQYGYAPPQQYQAYGQPPPGGAPAPVSRPL